MEPPTAKEIIKQENSYSIISDKNHSFNLIFQNLNSTIGILASYENDFIKHNYEKKLILDELKQNKYLALCETIDEIYDELIRLLNKNQFKIIEETNSIYISIPIEHSKLKEILFEVNEIIKNDSEKINELFSIISNMKKEIKEFKEQFKNEEINNLKEENKNMKQEIKNLKEEINNLKEENKNLKEEIKNIINNMNPSMNKSKILENQINNLNKEIEIIKEKNDNKNQIPTKKNINPFYGCNFVDEKYILEISGIELMKMNYIFNHKITLINNGNLPWPKKSFIYGKSNDWTLECKPLILNTNKEIIPNEKITKEISINLENIKNGNYEIILPLKLFFKDKSKSIKQNEFTLKVKAINLISIEMFNKIKQKLEEDYSLSHTGWSDNELMERIYRNLDDEIIGLLGKDDESVIDIVNEYIGEELLEV